MTDYLFAKPSFIGGMARVLDLGGTLNVYNNSATEEDADAQALRSDFKAIGKDLYDAIEAVERKNGGKEK